MRLIHNISKLSPFTDDDFVAVTIGNFDGVHLGHQELFSTLKREATALAEEQSKNTQYVLMSFFPHPKIVLSKVSRAEQRADSKYWSLTPLRAKAEAAKRAGFDCFFPVRFRQSFSALSPREFVETFLVNRLGVDLVVVGYDWSFGKNREGSPETLKKLGKEFGFEVRVVEPVILNEKRVSSSLVRSLLAEGDLNQLKFFLGRDFSICGRVVRGEQRGRKIGVPTANIIPIKQLHPPHGVYASTLKIAGSEPFRAVTNVGIRPTFSGEGINIETHVLDNSALELYGKFVEISFHEFIREEKKFAGLEQLKEQILLDISAAQSIHSRL